MKKIILIVLLGIGNSLFARHIDSEKLNTYFEVLNSNNKFMGTIAVTEHGHKLYSKSVGYADLELEIKATDKTVYAIGSISKTFTSVLIFQAIEKGKLDLNHTLAKYFPSIKNATNITISHLLYHRSGIHNFTADPAYLTWNTKSRTQQEMLQNIEDGGIDFEPDTKMQYSNSNYVLLSFILEKIHNKSFAKILEQGIIKPLKLTNTSIGENKGSSISKSYTYLDKWRVETNTHPSITLGAGGIFSTADDLNKFFEALFEGKLVSEKSLKQMTTLNDNCGMGLFSIPFGEKKGFGHSGGIDGFHSFAVYFPEDKISYSLTSNASNYIINDISIAILNCVYNLSFDIPDFSVKINSSEDLNKYLGVYSSAQLPIKLTITKNENTLVAQGSGQVPFNLEATSENIFRFPAAGIVMEFKPDEGVLILKQGGGVFLMKKEE